MKAEPLETWLNFRIDKNLQEQLDKRAKKIGLSRAELARQYFKMGTKLPIDPSNEFSILLYKRTSGMRSGDKVRDIAITIIEELFA